MYLSYQSAVRESTDCPDDFSRWIKHARCGSRTALGRLLSMASGPLLSAARVLLDGRLRAKVSAEDLVQDTFVEAQLDFDQFRGCHEREFLAWLLGILAHRVANSIRHYRTTQCRSIARELPFEAVGVTLSCVPDAAAPPDAVLLARGAKLGALRREPTARAVSVRADRTHLSRRRSPTSPPDTAGPPK